MSKSKSVIGLDIGNHSVKVVRLARRGKKVSVVEAEVLRLPASATAKSDVISGWLQSKSYGGYPCVVGLAGPPAMFQSIVLEKDDPRPVGQAVAMEISRFNELATESVSYGFSEIDGRILLAMARPSQVEAGLMLPRTAGVDIIDLVATPLAVFNAQAHTGSAGPEATVYVDVGHVNTKVAIGTEAGALFARTFVVGGQNFRDAVVGTGLIAANQVDNFMLTGSSLTKGDEAVREALTQTAEVWLAELQACLTVYRGTFLYDTDQPVKIVLSGGGAVLDGFPEYIAGRLGMEVTAPVPAPLAEIESDYDPRTFVIAYGLALGAMGLETTSLSLMPASMKEALMLRSQMRYWVASGVTIAMILAVILVGGYRDSQAQEKTLKAEKRLLEQCTELARRIDTTRRQSARVVEMVQPVGYLLHNGPTIRDLLTLLSTAKAEADWITLVADAESYFPQVKPADPRDEIDQPGEAPRAGRSALVGKQGKPAGRKARQALDTVESLVAAKTGDLTLRRFVIEGYTLRHDLRSVKRLLTRLQASDVIASADLLSDDEIVPDPEREEKWAYTGASRFVLEVEVGVPVDAEDASL